MPLNKYKDWQGNDIYTAAREDTDGNMITDTKLYAEDAQGNKVPLKVDASGNVLTQLTGSNAEQVESTQKALNQWMKNTLDDVNDIIAIGDGSGAKIFNRTHPGIVQEKGQKVDNAAFATNSDGVLPSLAGYYQPNSVDSMLNPLSIGALRATKYRTLVTAPDKLRLILSGSTPNPTGSDIKNSTGGNLASSDFTIRDTSWHVFTIPMNGWKNTVIHYAQESALNQPVRIELYGIGAGGTISSKLLSIQTPASSLINFAIGSGAAGVGATEGTTTVANNAYYNIPALNAGFDAVALYVKTETAPTAGKISNIMVVRSS